MAKLEELLAQHAVLKPNIYVRIKIDRGGYYKKMGYEEIYTRSHSKDDDPDAACIFGTEYCRWYAKALNKTVKQEELVEHNRLFFGRFEHAM